MDADELLLAAEVAPILRVAESTLTSWRKRGGGPPWFTVGKKTPVYRRSELDAFIDRRAAQAREQQERDHRKSA